MSKLLPCNSVLIKGRHSNLTCQSRFIQLFFPSPLSPWAKVIDMYAFDSLTIDTEADLSSEVVIDCNRREIVQCVEMYWPLVKDCFSRVTALAKPHNNGAAHQADSNRPDQNALVRLPL